MAALYASSLDKDVEDSLASVDRLSSPTEAPLQVHTAKDLGMGDGSQLPRFHGRLVRLNQWR